MVCIEADVDMFGNPSIIAVRISEAGSVVNDVIKEVESEGA